MILRKIKKKLTGGVIKRKYTDINPEDIFLDSANLPGFQEHAFEGRIERPMTHSSFLYFKVTLCLIMALLVGRLSFLSLWQGAKYAEASENNRLEHGVIFANRGAILDRNGVELAGNALREDGKAFASRQYSSLQGLAHLVGYIKYPKADKNGFYYDLTYQAKDGVERSYDSQLAGKNGLKLVERDVEGTVTSESVVEKPQEGESLMLSIDAAVTNELYKAIAELARSSRFVGGAGAIMDVETGELLALTSYPEYSQQALTAGLDQKSFTALLENPSHPFLNRAVGGLYTPGSVIKPVIALGALTEGIISPEKAILSTGSITVPNPYDPSKPSIFRDWKAHGWTDMRRALAVSSDTYFYSIGGGFGGQKGLGIGLIDKYLKMFGLEEKTEIPLAGEVTGLIPNPEWKQEKFNDVWRLGDTYITAIGQYGTQVTPINALRFIAAVANEGKFLKPSLLKGGEGNSVVKELSFAEKDWRVVHEGMHLGVEEGTSIGLNVPYVSAAAKTGTAEVGSGKSYVHSWSVGFFPYEKPRYAWVVVMEKGPSTNTVGATSVMRKVFDWIHINSPEYFIVAQ